MPSSSRPYFRPHTLGRQPAHAILELGAGLEPLGIRPARSVGGEEAEEAQDAQIVLPDAGFGIADEAHAPFLQILEPADEIDHLSVGLCVERVEGKVAPLGIALPVPCRMQPWRARPSVSTSSRSVVTSKGWWCATTVMVP